MKARYTLFDARRSQALLALVLICLLMVSGLPHTTYARSSSADLDVILWLSPANNRGSNVAEPGDLVYLDVRIENIEDTDASNIRVTLPYDRNTYLLMNNPAEVGANDFTVVEDRVPARNFRTMRVEMRIRNDIPLPSRIDMYGDYSWDDAGGGGDGLTNQVSLVINLIDDDDSNGDGGTRIVDIPRDTNPPDTCFLAMQHDGRGVTLAWGGRDDVSGIRNYDVQVMELPNGRWRDWQVNETGTSAWFGPLSNESFGFRVRARDNRGNEEAWTINPQLTTMQDDFDRSNCPGTGGSEPV